MNDPDSDGAIIRRDTHELTRTSRAFALVEKVLAESARPFLKFCAAHPEFTKRQISLFYPLKTALIERFVDEWDWDDLSRNEGLPWSEEFIDKHGNRWGWSWLSLNNHLPWSESLIARFSAQWNWLLLSQSSLLPWSESLIDRYADKWDWKLLSYNEFLPWNEHLIARFADQWDYKTLVSNSKAEPFLNKPFIENYMDEEARRRLSLKRLAQSITYEEPPIKVDADPSYWEYICRDEERSWNQELIERYADLWPWTVLSSNRSLPWSEAFIERFADRWDWSNVTFAMSRPWTESLITRFADRWDWQYLSSDYVHLPWNESFIERFADRWDWDVLGYNNALWTKVFLPRLNDDLVVRIMDNLGRTSTV